MTIFIIIPNYNINDNDNDIISNDNRAYLQ